MKIGRYRIQRQIAEGGQGSVLLGYDPRLRRRVAIKLYRLPDQRERRRLALREARRSAVLDSPRITRVFDVLVAGNDLAVIMEYVPGCDLRDVLAGRRLSLAAALSIASDIAAALAAARLRETVHGDIKPANILIATTGRAMLTDFGVAQVGAGATALGFSRSALTPEHVRGEALGYASDMFALGVLLYHMVSGVRPFGDGDTGSEAMCEGRFVRLAQCVDDGDIPPDLDVLVSRLLSPDPRQRPVSIHAVRQALRAVAVALPLGESAPVQRETEAFYRSERAADVPPELAAEFGDASRGRRLARRLRLLVVQRPALTAAGGAVLLLAAGLPWWLRPAPCVELQSPLLRVDAATAIGADISREWLQTVLRQSVEERISPVEMAGMLGDRGPEVIGRHADEQQCSVDHALQLRLECRQSLCLVSLSRNARPAGESEALFADASIAAWRAAIERLAAAALP